MGISKEAILDRLRGASDVVDFLQRLSLEPRPEGRELRLLCPFHDDHSPSCGVFNRSGSWGFKCFSCGVGGDLFDFYARLKGLDAGRDFNAIVRGMGGVLGISDVGGVGGGGLSDEDKAELAAKREAAAAKSLKIEEARRSESIGQARKLWNEAARWPLDVAARYFSARGINLEALPGGVLPPTIRYHPACYRDFLTGEEHPAGPSDPVKKWKTTKKEHVPAVICGARTFDDALPSSVQRIYLDPPSLREGQKVGKISYGFDSHGKIKAKATLGSKRKDAGGVAVRLAPPTPAGVLIVCEGIETGLAIQAAVGSTATVWALIDVEVMRFVDFPVSIIAPECGGEAGGVGWVKRLVFAGDLDKSKAGQKGAAQGASNALKKFPKLDVRVALPSHDVVPTLIGVDGKFVVAEAEGVGDVEA